MENKAKEGEAEGKKKATDIDYGVVGAAVLAIVIIAGLSHGYNVVTEKNRLTKLCNDYSLSPDLKYPTKCVPLLGDSSGGDYVDTRSVPRCKCTVFLENGTNTTIDVRVAS